MPYADFNTMLWKGGKASPEMSDPADEPNDPVEKQVALAQAMTTVAKFIWPIPDRNLRRRLPRVTAQTLIVFGADDAFVPAIYARRIRERDSRRDEKRDRRRRAHGALRET